jgi:diguanylate cyclase (GGDEF)-like protein
MKDINKNLLNPVKNIVLPYFIFGIVWILFSDTIVIYLLEDYISYQTIQSVKGILFILITGLFLYYLLKSNLKELEEKEDELYRLAYYDELTGLPNKKYLYYELNRRIEKNNKDKEQFSLFYININNFNTLTDIKGTSHGSEIIAKISDKLKDYNNKNKRPIGFLSSYNYNKFILLIKGEQNRKKLKKTAEQIINSLNELWEDRIIDYYLNIDIGISRFPDSGQNAEDLISAAKIAAHNIGEEDNNVKCYDHKMFLDKVEYENLKGDLRDAVANEQFELYYQPKIKIPEEKIYRF